MGSRHHAIIGQGKQLAAWIESRTCPRTLAHRLLAILNSKSPKRSALWAYQLGRNLPRRDARAPEERNLRQWAEALLNEIDKPDPEGMREATVALRYALTATRPRRD